MSDAPSWLNSGSTPAPAPAAAEDTFATSTQDAGVPAATTASTATAGGAAAAATDEELPGIILTMRLANMGVAVALMVCSILVMVGIPSITNWVLAIYATLGGLLVCCLETQLKFLRVIIAVNFGFLFDPIMRFLYYVLMASVCWAYEDLFGKIVAGCLVAVAIYNTYVLCRYPSYRKVREKIAEEEDKRIEARISKEVRKQAASQLTK